ncbi:MAG: HepT-like ribonuclease domain-containing protein [Patescibacteria group bacterium]
MDKDQIYLSEIKEFCQEVIDFTAQVAYEDFVSDRKLYLCVIKLIENIGEASKRLSMEAKSQYPKVEWDKAAKMRDRLVHHYMDVDLAIVFDVAINEIPKLFSNLS